MYNFRWGKNDSERIFTNFVLVKILSLVKFPAIALKLESCLPLLFLALSTFLC